MLRTLQDLTRDANALKQQGRIGEAIGVYQEAVRQNPASAAALHNLAAAYGDAGNHVDAERVAAMAMQGGLDAPETWLVRARARFGMGDFGGADTAYRSAIARRPENGAARMELSQMIWMRTGERAAALSIFDPPAGAAAPVEAYLAYLKAQALEFMNEADGALRLMRPLVARLELPAELRAPMLAFAAQLAAQTGDAAQAVALSAEAVRIARPGDPGPLEAEVCALLAAGAYEK
ncbi:MAG: tetratricopeptide repeat protein, partial [Hyphomonas sp.]|uniref:tetratricopeptide repeat protein n=1 Tax=Hyphomonas sp. TaxID=87 RepID=UPI0034A07453